MQCPACESRAFFVVGRNQYQQIMVKQPQKGVQPCYICEKIGKYGKTKNIQRHRR